MRARSVSQSTMLAAFVALLFLLVILNPHASRLATYALEDGVLTVAPSAERAYSYGERHFDARHPGEYDLARAESLFKIAEELHSDLPLVNHQIARIAFLRGDYRYALERINRELMANPAPSPSSYYMRGLIKGFMGEYDSAADDYATYLSFEPTNWAGVNDYAWVLLKAGRPEDALREISYGLEYWPQNPWLFNNKATALYELGRFEEAYVAAMRAREEVSAVNEAAWLTAYPGNDPLIASDGVAAFKKAIDANIHTITLARENSSLRVR